MIEQRYKIIKEINFDKQYLNCPVELVKGNILYDNKMDENAIQLKIRNISKKTIDSIYISIKCFDDANDALNSGKEITYSYMEISAKPMEAIGGSVAIYLRSSIVRIVDIRINKVVFSDGEIWRNENIVPMTVESQESIESLSEDLVLQYYDREDKGIYCEKRKFIPLQSDDFWQCSCGRINLNTESNCCRCGIDKEWVFLHANKDFLQKQLDDYRAEQAKLAVIIEKKRKENERIEIEKKQQQKKEIKRWVIILISIALIIVLIMTGTSLIKKAYKWNTYKKGKALLDSGRYIEAVQVFCKIEKPEAVHNVTKAMLQNPPQFIEAKGEEINIYTSLFKASVFIREQFIGDNISYDDAVSDLTSINGFLNIPYLLYDVYAVKESRDNFEKASSFQASGDYYDAVFLYDNVIPLDNNYKTARYEITSCLPYFKEAVIFRIEEYNNSANFSDGLDFIDRIKKFLGDDVDIENYRTKLTYNKNYNDLKVKGEKYKEKGANVGSYVDLYSEPNDAAKANRYTTGNWSNVTVYDYYISSDAKQLWVKVLTTTGYYWVKMK